MSTAPERTDAITLRKLADVVALVPYLLGFHPQRSLVALTIEDAAVRGTVRLDLTQDPAEIAERAGHLVDVLSRNRSHRALLIGYGSGAEVTPMVDAATEALRAAGIGISEAIRVDDGRYWSYVCTDVTCCPPEGTPVDLTSSVPAATAVLAGMCALPDRAALAATLDPPQLLDQDRVRDITREVCAQAKQRSKQGVRWFWDGANRVVAALERVQAGEDLDVETAIWIGVHLTAKPVRDMAMTYVPRYGAETHVRLWTEVTRKVHPTFATAPATLLAFAAMCRGNGALAGIALERALSSSPHNTLALLLSEGLMAGLHPSHMLACDWNGVADDLVARIRLCPSAAWPLLPEGW
ncbi:DUF4192 domain-containing protein [Nonomuraea sp. NPDC048892]|uniref:DUF4192 domain-containing protein n=1 Tax=Nonomuraea sp. NPDC048892 TaxID=3154624 RepID=UPI0033CA5EB2